MAKRRHRMRTFPRVGVWSFLIGIVISVLAVLIKDAIEYPKIVIILGSLGILVGILNITAKEAIPFLVAAIALVVAVSGMSVVLAGFVGFGQAWADAANALIMVLDNITFFVAPAALVVALKSIYVLAAD